MKHTKQTINNLLADRNILLVGDYLSLRSKTKFVCMFCQHTWLCQPENIISKNRGCPNCKVAPNKLTIKQINEKLSLKNIQFTDENYINSHENGNFKCLKCNYEWVTRIDKVLYSSGCLNCSGSITKTMDEINELLISRQIIALEQHQNNTSKIKFKCLKQDCQYEWVSTTDKVCNSEHGCHQCANHVRRTKEDINEILKTRNIELIDEHDRTSCKRNFLCSECGSNWNTSVANVLYGTGCPTCKNKNEKIFKKALSENNIKYEYQVNLSKLDNTFKKNYKVDFYFPNHKIIVEYNGAQHYQPIRFNGISDEVAENNFNKQIIRDNLVKNWCVTNNIKLIEVDGRNVKNFKINEYIVNFLIPELEMLS